MVAGSDQQGAGQVETRAIWREKEALGSNSTGCDSATIADFAVACSISFPAFGGAQPAGRTKIDGDESMMSADAIEKEKLEALVSMLQSARRMAILTGAGISTESGIPDFRAPGGIWTRLPPISFQNYLASADWRREAWSRRFALDEILTRARPNAGHRAVATLIMRGAAEAVITQNIDNLHQDSGVPSAKVIELHGNTHYALCLGCGGRAGLGPIRMYFEKHGEPPDCAECGGIMKTATISFGQPMPETEMRRAEEEARKCDVFLVLGTSLAVYPAAALPVLARRRGAKLVIINREPTELDSVADLAVHAEIGMALPQAIARAFPL